ncbi:serine/threonine-protein kinase nek8 [Plakobranchus ocellatus]|uniref:non-specific serine/threonine protein kinase n=1 Tax=Plakobranchus ocellatus TaxID=259542 RepID=A0AAV4AY36_9GAST|nr:serine/threonine-protein kinase nek8 [Plakobranchus ocellatus]
MDASSLSRSQRMVLMALQKTTQIADAEAKPSTSKFPAHDIDHEDLFDLNTFNSESQAVGAETLMPGATEGSSPTLIPRYLEGQAAVTIQHVACGDLFTACLTDRGILMTFGSGVNGCLGHGNCNDVAQAKIVEALLGYEVVQVSCGASHVLAVTNEHEVFAWGRGDNGRLGLGDYASCTSPQPVSVPEGCRPCSVHCGMDCSVILTLERMLLCSGSNRYNKLALDCTRSEFQDRGERMSVIEEVALFTPVASEPINSLPIKMVSLGTSHSAIVTEAGECYTAGSNQFGQLGAVTEQGSRGGPVLVPALSGKVVSLLACGDIFTVAVTQDQVIYTWGKTSRGRLGRPDQDSHLPGAVTLPQGDNLLTIVSVSSSHGSTLVAAKPMQRSSSPV